MVLLADVLLNPLVVYHNPLRFLIGLGRAGFDADTLALNILVSFNVHLAYHRLAVGERRLVEAYPHFGFQGNEMFEEAQNRFSSRGKSATDEWSLIRNCY